MRIFKFAVPIMAIVATLAWTTLGNNHPDVPYQSRVLITVGAALLSGIISFFLFPKNEGERY